ACASRKVRSSPRGFGQRSQTRPLLSCQHHISPAWRNGRAAPFFYESGAKNVGGRMEGVHTKERQLEQELAGRIEQRVPGTEVLAVELLGPERFCVYIDHPKGVDHALCERVTRELDDYRRNYTVDVSSPGIERPLRKPEHFERFVGRRVALRTAAEIAGRKRFKGELIGADEQAVHLATEPKPVDIPYEQIVRGNLIDEGSK